MKDNIDLRRLAEDAVKNAYDPRAKRCMPFHHEWSMWTVSPSLIYTMTEEIHRRRCVRCGKTKVKVKKLTSWF